MPQAAVGLPVDMDDWNGANFIQYYEALIVNGYTSTTAKNVFNSDIQNTSFTATIRWSGEYDCDFLHYTAQRGLINFGGIIGNAYCGTSAVVSSAGSAASNVGNAVSFLTQPVILIPVAGFLAYQFWFKKKKRK